MIRNYTEFIAELQKAGFSGAIGGKDDGGFGHAVAKNWWKAHNAVLNLLIWVSKVNIYRSKNFSLKNAS
jgi:hypothetical protein